MDDQLSITIIQSILHWEDPEANRRLFSEKIKNISAITDLIILPEMFTTGFSMNAEMLAEENFQDVSSLKGGIDLWFKKGYPTTSSLN